MYIVVKPNVSASDEEVEQGRRRSSEASARSRRPKNVWVVPDMPKTRSGKIMRRVIAWDLELRRRRRCEHALESGRGRRSDRDHVQGAKRARARMSSVEDRSRKKIATYGRGSSTGSSRPRPRNVVRLHSCTEGARHVRRRASSAVVRRADRIVGGGERELRESCSAADGAQSARWRLVMYWRCTRTNRRLPATLDLVQGGAQQEAPVVGDDPDEIAVGLDVENRAAGDQPGRPGANVGHGDHLGVGYWLRSLARAGPFSPFCVPASTAAATRPSASSTRSRLTGAPSSRGRAARMRPWAPLS